MLVPNQLVRKFFTDHNATLVYLNYENRCHVFRLEDGCIAKIPTAKAINITIIEEYAEYLEVAQSELDYWFTQNGINSLL